MIHCPTDIADLLVDLSDGELTGAERERAERHLLDCASCQREFARLNQSLARLRAGFHEIPANARRAQSPVGWASLAWCAGGAALLLLAIGAAFISQPQRGTDAALSAKAVAPPLAEADVLLHIALVEQQARLSAAQNLLPDDPRFADQRAANERLRARLKAADTHD
jgi:anti-sigma factor RsiW